MLTGERLETVKTAQKAISDMLNSFGADEAIETFIDEESRDHRTLQQNFTRLCLGWIKHLASLNDSQYDLRNEDSVNVARMLESAVGDKDIWADIANLRHI